MGEKVGFVAVLHVVLTYFAFVDIFMDPVASQFLNRFRGRFCALVQEVKSLRRNARFLYAFFLYNQI